MLIRQAHPGPGARPYRSFEEKARDGERHKIQDAVPYTVLIDDLEGTVHQAYGGLADPTYLIDSDGRVAFYNMWTHAPTLHRALEQLNRQGWRGIVNGGVDRKPHLLPSMVDGWKGLQRGAPQSVIELEMSAPGMASGTWLGYQLRSALAPIALRAKPLPTPVKLGLIAAAVFLAGLGISALARRRPRATDWD